jgi:hypothetical protein
MSNLLSDVISQPRNGHHCRLYSSIEARVVSPKSCFRRQPAGNSTGDETVTDEVKVTSLRCFLERPQKIPLPPVIFNAFLSISFIMKYDYKGKILFDKRFAETVTSAWHRSKTKALSPHPR